MKTETQTLIDFTTLLPVMESIHNGEMKLQDALLALWGKQTDKSNPMGFRKAFVAFAESNGYCRAWSGQIARDAGFRVRSKRSDIGKAKTTKVVRFTIQDVFDKWLASMPTGLTAKQRKAVLAKLAN